MPADMDDDEVAVDHRRHGRVEHRLCRGGGMLPEPAAGRGIERRDQTGHAEREQAPAGERRRGLRTRTVPRRGGVDGEWRRVARAPDDRSRAGVERHHDFVVALPRERVDAVAHHERRGVAGAHLHLPPCRQRLRPRRRLAERRSRTVAVGPAPLRPVLGRRDGREPQRDGRDCSQYATRVHVLLQGDQSGLR